MRKSSIILLITLIIYAFNVQNSFAQAKTRLGGSIGVALPTGDLGDLTNTGFGFQADAKFTVANKIGIGADIGWNIFGFEVVDNVNAQIIPIRVSGEYFFISGPIQPYVSGGLGIYVLDLGGSAIDNVDSETEAGFQFGGGAIFKAGKFNINSALKFNFFDGGGFIDLKVGLLFGL